MDGKIYWIGNKKEDNWKIQDSRRHNSMTLMNEVAFLWEHDKDIFKKIIHWKSEKKRTQKKIRILFWKN